MNDGEICAALRPVVAELVRQGVRWYVGGSVASSIYGNPRTTLDVDIIAALQSEHVDAFVAALEQDYFVSRAMILDAIARCSCFNVIYNATGFKVDVFIPKNAPFDKVSLERSRPDTLGRGAYELPIMVATAEDITLNKLVWYRLGDEISERQWNDAVKVAQLLKHSLDRDYLAHWAAELKVTDLLERMWHDVGSFE